MTGVSGAGGQTSVYQPPGWGGVQEAEEGTEVQVGSSGPMSFDEDLNKYDLNQDGDLSMREIDTLLANAEQFGLDPGLVRSLEDLKAAMEVEGQNSVDLGESDFATEVAQNYNQLLEFAGKEPGEELTVDDLEGLLENNDVPADMKDDIAGLLNYMTENDYMTENGLDSIDEAGLREISQDMQAEEQARREQAQFQPALDFFNDNPEEFAELAGEDGSVSMDDINSAIEQASAEGDQETVNALQGLRDFMNKVGEETLNAGELAYYSDFGEAGDDLHDISLFINSFDGLDADGSGSVSYDELMAKRAEYEGNTDAASLEALDSIDGMLEIM
nr:hypothetical protein [Acidiferrobacterales bacterium]